MAYGYRIFSPIEPQAAAAENASVESALRIPRLIDGELVIDEARTVSFGDIPANVLLTCPGIRCFFDIRLAGGEGSGGNIKTVDRFARTLANALGGAAVAHDSGAVFIGENTAGYVIPPVNSATPMLTLSCHFMPSASFEKYAEAFVALLESCLPCALPVKYGQNDTPEFEFAAESKEHLIGFLKNTPAPVWYAHAPATHVLISDAVRPSECDGLRASRVAVTVSAAVWEYPEWQFALRRLLCGMMSLFDGFFGQIVPSEKLGVAAWWWQGLPSETGYIFAVGEPYRTLITDDGKNISDDPAFAVFDGDNAPQIPRELISFPRSGKHGDAVRRTGFTRADKIPF